MIVSAAFGSNIFDILIGLGLPWFLSTTIKGKSYVVKSDNLFISVLVLIIVLIIFIFFIILTKWVLNKKFGIILLICWLLVVTQALLISV